MAESFNRQMKPWFFLIIFFWGFNSFARENDGGLVRVILWENENHSYFDLNQITRAPSWDPIPHKLPLKIDSFVTKAAGHLMSLESNSTPPDLVQINMGSLEWDARNTNTSRAPVLSNKWVIQFFFLWQNPSHASQTRMLFDGTFSRDIDISKLTTPDETNKLRQLMSPFSPALTDQGCGFPDFQSSLDKPDLKISNITWDPASGAKYPLDLEAEALRFRTFAAEKLSQNQEAVSLIGIELVRWLPLAAIQAQHLKYSKLPHQWATFFRYRAVTAGQPTDYCVCELLDGTVLTL